MSRSYVVVLAGVPGSSKTPIALYLSQKFNLPIINSDQIRFEVKEDLLINDINGPKAHKEFLERLAERRREFLSTGKPVIFDCGIDRSWSRIKRMLTEAGYNWYMINMELSRSFLEKLFTKTGRADLTSHYLDHYIKQHQDFMKMHGSEVNLTITDKDFPYRLQLAGGGLQKFIGS